MWYNICRNSFTMKHKLLLFFIIATILCGCKGMFDEPGRRVHINDALMKAFNFQKGSYWIYKDVLTGRTDSFYVSGNEAGTNSTTPHNPKEAIHTEYIYIYISQKNIGPSPSDTLISTWQLSLSDHTMHIGSNTITWYFGDKSSVYYPFQTATGDYTFNGITYINTDIIGIADSEKAGPYNPKAYKAYDSLYLCPGTGFIRMNFDHPLDTFARDWQLQRSKIVQ